jgi:DnaK suppressor protein
VSKTPAKSAAAPSKTVAAKKAPTKASAPADEATPPAPPRAAKTAAAKPGPAKAPTTARAGAKTAEAPVPELAVAEVAAASPLSSNAEASRFADRFAPPKPASRSMVPPVVDTHNKPAAKPDPKLANAWKSKSGRELTEAELLAMPEGEYMNEKQLDFFRAKLQALKDDLLSNADETTEHLREDTTIVPDPADRATIEEEHALELRTRDRERKLLKKISQSLARIDAGDYGFCDETGEPIGLARLIARPTATLSLEAQQRREMKQKMFGD